MIRFNEGSGGLMEKGFALVHPDVQELLAQFAVASSVMRWPEPVITDAIRSPAQQLRIYHAYYCKLRQAVLPGPRHLMIDTEGDGSFRPLTPAECAKAPGYGGLTDEAIDALARKQFTWHWVRCAVDLRSRHYDASQLADVKAWFTARCQGPRWEYLVHDVTAPHMHVARRDQSWREKFLAV